MAGAQWKFDLEDGSHTVELEHGLVSGKRAIRVDGKLIHESHKVMDMGSTHTFRINEHEFLLRIHVRMSIRYELKKDGVLIPRGGETNEATASVANRPPFWAWIPIILCGIVTAVGAIFTQFYGVSAYFLYAGLGLAAAGACWRASQTYSLNLWQRIGLCTLITIGCWVLFGVLIVLNYRT